MSDDDLCRELFEAPDPNDEGEACAHWHTRSLCAEPCSCGHGCNEHWCWGGCSLCACIVWEERGPGLARVPAPAPQPRLAPDDEDAIWLADDEGDYEDAAGF